MTDGNVAVTGISKMAIALNIIFIFSTCGFVTPASPPIYMKWKYIHIPSPILFVIPASIPKYLHILSPILFVTSFTSQLQKLHIPSPILLVIPASPLRHTYPQSHTICYQSDIFNVHIPSPVLKCEYLSLSLIHIIAIDSSLINITWSLKYHSIWLYTSTSVQ